jgi:hypothetical protein
LRTATIGDARPGADRDSQAVKFVKPNFLHLPGHSIGEDYGLADKLGLSLLELAEDRGRRTITIGMRCSRN